MKEDKKLFLLDAYALIFRAYYAFISRPIINSKGLNTSAIYGFTNTLFDILKTEKPTHIAVAFDPPAPTFRHEKYNLYKANRQETPEDIKKSVPYIRKIIEAFNIPIIEYIGYEADDVVGTVSYLASEKDFVTYMMTPDKDYAQLVNENVYMYKPGRSGNKAEIFGIQEVKDWFEIENPSQVIDILALMGDSSDNIPGAPGIGEKTAKKLIKQFGSLENLLENTDQLKGKQKEKIEDNIEQILLSKELVTIITDVPVECDFDKLKFEVPESEPLLKLFEELEFKTISDRIMKSELFNDGVVPQESKKPSQPSLFDNQLSVENSTYHTLKDVDHEYKLVQSDNEIDELIGKLNKVNEFCFDTETTGLDVINSELVGISFCFKKGEAFYVPFPENSNEALALIEKFKSLFANPKIQKIGHNLKYDIQILKRYEVEVNGSLFDTMIAHYLVQPELKHKMDYLAEVYLNYKAIPIEDLIGKKGVNQLNMRSINSERVVDYACEDADITFKLKEILFKELKENNLLELSETIEMPLVNVLADMEINGVSIDINNLDKYAQVLKEKLDKVTDKIYELAGEQFNIASPKQLGIVLFEKLKVIENPKKTKTKQYSTGEEILQQLTTKHEIIPLILDFRGISKLLNTYVEALPKIVNKTTGKIHTSFNQTVAATGRLSSNNPNLQNIPIREEEGREIRKAFVPSDDDHVLLAADYSQIELRIMAHLSEDEKMIEAFNNDEDIHAATAANIFKVSLEEVTSDQRRKAKTANFGIIYGISAFGLSQRLSIPRSEAKELIDGYFATFKNVQQYMNQAIMKGKEKSYVETLFHRRRYLKNINSNNAVVRGVDERNAINAPIQGSAADIIKIAMIRIFEAFKKQKLKSKMLLQVHDELIFDVNKPELDKVKSIVQKEMESAANLAVPLIVDMGSGNNWLEAH